MEESIKNRVILILGILAIIFFMSTIRSCNAERVLKITKADLDREKAANWDSEQKTNELKKEKGILEKELIEAKAAYEAGRKALVQEQLINQSLKEELQKVTKLKDMLEEDLKEALAAAAKPVKPKKQP